MSEGIERRAARSHQAEAMDDVERDVRDHLQLRARFASKARDVLHIPISDALLRYTDTYARVFGKRIPVAESEKDPRWLSMMSRVESGESIVDVAAEYRREYGVREESREFFGPFRYDYDPHGHIVNIHFGSMGWSEDERDAPTAFAVNLRPALTDMFRAIKLRHQDAQTVQGGSWLYTRLLESPRLRKTLEQTFPPAFIASSVTEDGAPSRGGGRWGQFVDNRGKVHVRRKREFEEKMQKATDEAGLLASFPIQPTMLDAPIEDFYKEYGIA